MMSSQPSSIPPNLSAGQASALLRLGRSGPSRPVDQLLERLDHEQNPDVWLEGILERGPLAGLGSIDELIIRGRGTEAQFRELKERGKTLVRSHPDHESYLAGLASYFLAIAAARRNLAVQIGGEGREDLASLLLEFASCLHGPLSEMLADAAGSQVRD